MIYTVFTNCCKWIINLKIARARRLISRRPLCLICGIIRGVCNNRNGGLAATSFLNPDGCKLCSFGHGEAAK